MAGPNDPFTPGPMADPTAGIPNPDTFESIRNQWTTFLDQPGARTALLQFGVNLMQPPSFGDTPASQIGRAVGAAGAAVTRGEALASKQELEAARAEAVGARAGQATERLGLEYFRRKSIEKGQEANNAIQAMRLYEAQKAKAMAGWQAMKDKAALGLGKDPGPFKDMTFEEWAKERGMTSLPGVASMLQSAKPQAKPQAADEDEGE